MRIVSRIEVFLLRHLGFSPIALLTPGSVLVLETVGRRSSRRRSAPLAYWVAEDGALMIGGGAAGSTTDPDWVQNLRANRCAAVWIRRLRVVVEAHELTGAPRTQARNHAASIWKKVPVYERRASRNVPYFRLVITENPQ